MEVRFVVSDINDKELLDDNVYDVFEPTLSLEIRGRDVFEEIGLHGIKKVIVMRFLESALKLTQRMIDDIHKRPTDEYVYRFLGTGYGLRVNRQGDGLELRIHKNPRMGPLKERGLNDDMKILGQVGVKDWVRSVTSLSRQLADRIAVANPRFKPYLASQEKRREALEDWVNAEPPVRL